MNTDQRPSNQRGQAQHEETGRMWEGPREQIPKGYAEVRTSKERINRLDANIRFALDKYATDTRPADIQVHEVHELCKEIKRLAALAAQSGDVIRKVHAERDAAHAEIERLQRELAVSKEGRPAIIQGVAVQFGQYIVYGSPAIYGWLSEDDEAQHNCDAMGCGQEHVLARFPIETGVAVTKPDRLANEIAEFNQLQRNIDAVRADEKESSHG